MNSSERITWMLIVLTTTITFISLMSSFHQTAREEQLKSQMREFQEFNHMMVLAKNGDPEALDNFMREKYGETDYCICVPWSEKMIKKMGRDVYHGTKKVYTSLGGN